MQRKMLCLACWFVSGSSKSQSERMARPMSHDTSTFIFPSALSLMYNFMHV